MDLSKGFIIRRDNDTKVKSCLFMACGYSDKTWIGLYFEPYSSIKLIIEGNLAKRIFSQGKPYNDKAGIVFIMEMSAAEIQPVGLGW